MNYIRNIVSILFCVAHSFVFTHSALAQDSIKQADSLHEFGQISFYIQYNSMQPIPLQLGLQYIPTLEYRKMYAQTKGLDFEASVKTQANILISQTENIDLQMPLSPYRAWGRYFWNQGEIRLGLQKLNFGSAQMLRPLMWFDYVDPRDPLSITSGVWGVLARYYGLRNSTLWVWGLCGNTSVRVWDVVPTKKHIPEYGMRMQIPLLHADVAVNYHYRVADSRLFAPLFVSYSSIPEHRLGCDARWDTFMGIWVETSWIHRTRPVGIFTNTHLTTIGGDYTFALGKGVYVMSETMCAMAYDTSMCFAETHMYTANTISYPLSYIDNLSAIVYVNWQKQTLYSYIQWKHSFKRFASYVMAYVNPDNFSFASQEALYQNSKGIGFQCMVVYHY